MRYYCGSDLTAQEKEEAEEIYLVNKIIANAVIHGGDIGGSYESNKDGLYAAINAWLKARGYDRKYHIIDGTYRMRLEKSTDNDKSYALYFGPQIVLLWEQNGDLIL